MATGIVLGGGGTLGDFQVGALKFLYEKGVLPYITCACGTSIGAINALLVSTGPGCDERLESYWSENVLDRVDLIPQHPWSEHIMPVLKAFVEAEKRLQLPGESRVHFMGRVRALAAFFQESGGIPQGTLSAIKDFEVISGTAIRESALYSADTLRQRLQKKKDTIRKALDPNIVFCLYATNVETGEKTCFTNNTELVETHGGTRYVQCHSSNLLVDAALASAAVPLIFPPVAVKVPDGEECDRYFMDGGVREIVPVKAAIACGADKIYAILCLPRFATKRKYAFLDVKDVKGKIVSTEGSTSNLLDVQPEDWVVNNRDWNPRSDECDVIDIANRATALVLDELTEGDLIATNETGDIAKDALGNEIVPIVIDPLIPVHGWTQLNIGLLKINADQGYMRAFDVLCAEKTPIEEQCEELTAEITVLRIKIWTLEHQLIEEVAKVRSEPQSALKPLLDGSPMSRVVPHCCGSVVNTKNLLDIRQMKKDLKECIERRLDIVERSSLSADDKKRSLPDDYICMYMCWEPHNWSVEGKEEKPPKPLGSTPWHKLDLGEFGVQVIEEDWSLGQPPATCKARSLLHFGTNSRQVRIT